MRVLYATWHPNALSESYIRTEIDWMEEQGVETAMWSSRPHLPQASYSMPPRRRVFTDMRSAVQEFHPDLVHAHWFRVAEAVAPVVFAHMLPMTVRGHSFGEDRGTFSRIDRGVQSLVAAPSVERIWMFPHVAARYEDVKVLPLPVCFDSKRYRPASGNFLHASRAPYVFRAGPGKAGKGIDEFLEIAQAAPDIKFILALTSMVDRPDAPTEITSTATPNVEVFSNLQHDNIATLMRGASVYLRGHELTGHPFGMPISMAEAMGSGTPVLGRADVDGFVTAYVGAGGACYSSIPEAVDLIRGFLHEGVPARRRAFERSRVFTADVVLPEVLREWKRIAGL